MAKNWRPQHKQTIEDFLHYMNKKSDNYVLKGGTALMECYGLDRFSEDIDLDSTDRQSIPKIVNQFCADRGFEYRTAKDTDTVKRYFINYGNKEKPLKVEISYRQKEIKPEFCLQKNGINVYTMDRLARMKSAAYCGRDKIRDLYDLCFITNNHWQELSPETQDQLRISFEAKGIEQFDYIINTQQDDLIDTDKLADDVLTAFDRLDLLSSNNSDEGRSFEESVLSIPSGGGQIL